MPAVMPKMISGNPPPTIGKKVETRKKDTHEQMVTVWSPSGEKVRVERHQANDLVRHVGYSTVPPKGSKDAEEHTEEDSDDRSSVVDSAPSKEQPPKEPDELDLLRAAYKEKTGQDADQRWGKRRLQEELEK